MSQPQIVLKDFALGCKKITQCSPARLAPSGRSMQLSLLYSRETEALPWQSQTAQHTASWSLESPQVTTPRWFKMKETQLDCLVLQRRGVRGVGRADRRQGHGHFAFFTKTQGHARQTLKLPKGPGFPMEKTMGSWLPWVHQGDTVP